MSEQWNGPVVSNNSNTNERTKFLLVPCLAMDEVPEHHRPMCVSVVDPYRLEYFIRTYITDYNTPDVYLETDVDYDPRSPATFERDASFIMHRDLFYPGYVSFESVRYRNHFVQVGRDGRMEVNFFRTAEFRHKASFVGTVHSSWGKLTLSNSANCISHLLTFSTPCK